MDNESYNPVPHDTLFREQLLSDPAVKAAFENSAAKYTLLNELLNAKHEAGLTQAQIAEKMGIKSATVARLENALASGKNTLSIDKLTQYASAVGKKVEIHIV
jgi:predicted XRE-type DNA-binding protein